MGAWSKRDVRLLFSRARTKLYPTELKPNQTNPSNKPPHPPFSTNQLFPPSVSLRLLPSLSNPLSLQGVELCEAYDAGESRRSAAEAEASAAASDAMRKRGTSGAGRGKKGKVGRGAAALVVSKLSKQQVAHAPV